MPADNTVFEAKLDSASVFKKVIDAIKDLIGDTSWDCTNTGMSLQSMDSSHVALVNVLMRSEGFDSYKCSRNISMGISLNSMAKVLKCAGNEDSITISHDSNSNVVSFAFHNLEAERAAEFELKLMNIDTEHLGIPETEYDCIIKLPSLELKRICQDLTQFGDSVNIACAKSEVKFETTGDIGKGNIRLAARKLSKAEQEITIEMENPVSLIFAIKYLNFFTRATPLSDTVRLCMSNNHPLCIEYPLPSIGYIRYYLAPKLEDTEE
ncbi:proliferating cell nuclear antigen-like [Paramacrobiotus metropolitanus]|uniref:proliferating cell nuclear antigen-like n=1 Tax=Paramacrobiotus metropolitanus TaxID=2943436 RepID=UPI0024462184|nr:proliferating cell nuclear antigen-like [Paramacrobiotus metropolitanus]